jgi:hypothetical protein
MHRPGIEAPHSIVSARPTSTANRKIRKGKGITSGSIASSGQTIPLIKSYIATPNFARSGARIAIAERDLRRHLD